MKKSVCSQNEDLRSKVREAVARGAFIEFKPAPDAMVYQLPLRDWSSSGLGILVKKDSDICRRLEVGTVLPVTLHQDSSLEGPDRLNVEIRHISDPKPGQHPDHCIVGLSILERITG